MATERYLPAGTRLVLVPHGKGRPEWYETRKEVTLDGETPVATCPIRGESLLRYQHRQDGKTFTVFFQESEVLERYVRDPSETVKKLNLYLLIYDIPTARDKDCPNPTPVLRRIAVRINLSCWVIPEENIPYQLLHTMAQNGATWYAVKFDAGEGKQIVGMAVRALRREVAEAAVRAAQSEQAAADAMAASAGNATQRDRASQRYELRTREVANRLQKVVEDLQVAAQVFDIPPDDIGLGSAYRAATALRTAMHTRARLFAEAPSRVRALAVADAAAMATAAERGTVPYYVVADFLQEFGDEAGGEMLRAAFTPAAEDTD